MAGTNEVAENLSWRYRRRGSASGGEIELTVVSEKGERKEAAVSEVAVDVGRGKRRRRGLVVLTSLEIR